MAALIKLKKLDLEILLFYDNNNKSNFVTSNINYI